MLLDLHVLKSTGILLSMCCKDKQGHCFPTATSCYGSQTHAPTNQSKVHQSAFSICIMFFIFKSLCREKKIILIFTAPLWDKYKIIPYPVVYFIHRFYLTGLWMQRLHLNTRLPKLSEFINLQEIPALVIIYDHAMNSHKVIPEVCFRSELW